MSKITVYTTPTCAFCHALKQWLTQKEVEFTEVDVSQDQAAAQAMVQKTGQMGVPVTFIDDQFVVGFDQTKLTELLQNT